MTSLLEHLGKDTLPEPILKEFARWCVLEQARPALAIVLKKATMNDLADSIQKTDDIKTLVELSQQATKIAKDARNKTGPLVLSGAYSASFEFNNLVNAASESEMDAEAVSFFSARVCGWAGWVTADNFANTSLKTDAETRAKKDQEQQLEQLWNQYGTQQT